MQVKKATVRTGHGTTDWFHIGVLQGCILSPCLFNVYASCKMLGRMKHKLESRFLGKIITSDRQMTPPLWQKSKKTKEPLDESERGEFKSWLKTQHSEYKDHDIQSHHFMANRWRNNGNSERLYFLGFPNHCRW